MRSMVLARAQRVQRRQQKVPGFRGRQRGLNGLEVAHFAQQDHVRRLPERRAQRVREVRRVQRDFALANDSTSGAGAGTRSDPPA